MNKIVRVGDVEISNDLPITIIAGPCQLESLEHSLVIAETLAKACEDAGLGFIFKGSFDKANRTSIDAKRGVGIEAGLNILSAVKTQFGCPVLTDIHTVAQCDIAAEVVDILQIPAFLCRQTDLLVAAGKTGKAVNVKKGQFLAAWDMQHVAAKIASTENQNILLCERGSSFGYNTLVTDMLSLPEMAKTGYPVVIDATHSVQMPGGQGTSSGGNSKNAPVVARAAVSVGVAAVFMETHENPNAAPSDGPNMIPLDEMGKLINDLAMFDKLAKSI